VSGRRWLGLGAVVVVSALFVVWPGTAGVAWASSSSAAYRAEVMADAPLAYWRLGEAAGPSVVDEVVPGFPAGYDTAYPYARGREGIFGPQGDRGSGPGRLMTTDGPQPEVMSIEVWFKSEAGSDGLDALFNYFDAHGPGLSLEEGVATLRLAKPGRESWLCNGWFPDGWVLQGGRDLRDGQWHHVVATVQAPGAVRIWVDGAPVAAASYPWALRYDCSPQSGLIRKAGPKPMNLGTTFHNRRAAVILDEVALFGSVLSPQRIRSHYASSGRVPPPLLSPEELLGGRNPSMACFGCSADRVLGAVGPISVPLVADPVVPATGNYTESATDVAVPGRGPGLVVTRTYNSQLAGDVGLFGRGWRSNLDAHVTVESSGVVVVRQENGSVVRFEPRPDGVRFSAPPRVTATLTKDPASGSQRWRLVRGDGSTLWFDEAGRVSGFGDRNGYVTSVEYPSGSQMVVREPDGDGAGPGVARSLSVALAGGRVVSVTDPVGRVVSYAYSGDRLVRVESFKAMPSDPSRVSWVYGYDGAQRLSTVTDPRGYTTTTVYDGSGRVDYQLDRAGRRTDIDYAGSNPLTVDVTGPPFDEVGSRSTTRYVFTDLLMTSKTVGFGSPEAATWTFAYDPGVLGVTSVVGPDGRVHASVVYDAAGNPVSVTDVMGRRSEFSYDRFGNVVTARDPAGLTTTNTYDGRGNLLESATPSVEDPGRVRRITYQRGDAAHPEDVTAVVPAAEQGKPTPKTWRFEYDPSRGYRTAVTDPEGNRSEFGFDEVGRRRWQVAPKGVATPGVPDDYRTTFTTNDFGDVIGVSGPVGSSSRVLDRARQPVSVTDADGNTTQIAYDPLGRPEAVTRPDGTVVRTQYYPDGSLRAQLDGAGASTGYRWDAATTSSAGSSPFSIRAGTVTSTSRAPGTGTTPMGW
jgi:YD repeat-containing protein